MCPIFTTFALLVLIIALIYLFLVWNFGYWRKRGIKEAHSYPFVGSFPSQFTQKRNIVYDIDELYRQHKDDENFIGVCNGRTPQLLLLNTECTQNVLVKDFRHFYDNEFSNYIDKKTDRIFGNNVFVLKGEEWKERRAEITPALTSSRVSSVYPITLRVSKSFSDYIKTQMKMPHKDGLDAKELCLRFTTEDVSDCVLGIQANSFSDNPTPIFSMIKKVFEQSHAFIIYTVISNLVPFIRKFYAVRFFSKQVEDFFFDLMKKSIQIRRESNDTSRKDFLNYILQLQEKKELGLTELTAHTITFLTDGFETTASVMAHTLLLLARYPKTQEKLYAEIGTEDINYDKLNGLPYMDACIHEAIRIFPPQLLARKICTEPYEFINKNGNSVAINAGTVVLIPAYSFHHDPNIFDDPEEYKPERFLEENGGVKKFQNTGAYTGFGNGPRICLGQRFAMTQMKAALVEILRSFRITVNEKTRKDNYLDETYFMARLNGGVWLNFEERT